MADTYKKKVEKKQYDPSSLSFASVFKLLEDNGTNTTRERLAVYARITLKERPAVLVLVKEPISIRVIWVAEKIT